jgi:hypothetical protein
VIGSTGWIAGTNCERHKACYPTRVALTYPADEVYARIRGNCPIRRENGGIWRRRRIPTWRATV